MKLLIVSGNPKKEDGLCHDLEEAVKAGAQEAGAAAEFLYADNIPKCHVCGGGWGICREKHACAFADDGFGEAQATVREADMYCLSTPVYWQESSEHLKALIDRLRRCEFGQGALFKKPSLLLASAGGSGNGILQALEQLQRFVVHTGGSVYDMIGQNRWNAAYKQKAASEAAKAMVLSLKNA
jgi:multimeric flavodoxin WrbA